jgi:hypothetical protein
LNKVLLRDDHVQVIKKTTSFFWIWETSKWESVNFPLADTKLNGGVKALNRDTNERDQEYDATLPKSLLI